MEDECVEELGRPISSLKVAELRDELTRRALTKTGNKKELIDRLRAAIQRQTSQANVAEQSCHHPAQEQQHFQQNVPQNLSATIAMQQNQVATAYQQQLNQLQSQAHISTYLPITQQQYTQPIMQPLNLQQQLVDYQVQAQFVKPDNQIQPLVVEQQKQQSLEEQKEQEADDSTPNIEEKVENNDEDKNIDQKTTEKQPEKSEVEEVRDEPSPQLDEPSTEQNEPSSEPHKPSSKADKISSEATEILPGPAKSSPDPDKPSLEPDKSSLQNTKPVEKSSIQDSITNEDSETGGLTNIDDNPSQTTFSLKRSISDSRTSSGNKEKRRKWSSKTSTDHLDDFQRGESLQTNIISGGISSQKLQELIDEKNDKQTTSAPTVGIDNLPNKTKESNIEEVKDLEVSNDVKPVPIVKQSKITEKVETVSQNEVSKEPQQIDLEQEGESTHAILVQNLVRPFTIQQLKEVLSKFGPLVEEKFWTDKVKSKCCAMYESVEIAKLTKESLHGQQWPSSNPKTLKVTYITEDILDRFQSSETAKNFDTSNISKDLNENGNNVSEQANKSITERLGERFDEGDAPTSSELVKKRLGERVSGEADSKSSNVNRDNDDSQPQELDDLFRKTISVPHLFWLPLTEDQADVRQKERQERLQRNLELSQKSRRSPPRRRSPIRHRSPADRRSPIRQQSPLLRRSSPPRHRSPVARRSPIVRRSPPRYRSRSPNVRRFPARHRSPAARRSPLRHRSPGTRRSPVLRRSPAIRRSPMRQRSPIVRRSPPKQWSPVVRRSPPRNWSPIDRRSPQRHRTPLLRRSPPRRWSPGRPSPPRRRSPGPIRK